MHDSYFWYVGLSTWNQFSFFVTFQSRNKTFCRCLFAFRRECLGEFESRSVNTRNAFVGFYLLKNSQKLCRGFHQAIKAQITFLISFLKWSDLTKRKTIYEASMYIFTFFVKRLILTTLRQPTILLTSFLYFIALRKHICWPIKTHILPK